MAYPSLDADDVFAIGLVLSKSKKSVSAQL